MPYDAFISYSHARDGSLAPALQTALHRFAKPFYRRRAIQVFRDKTSMSATPELWGSIEAALRDSEYFILMASPEAAASRWVRDEVDFWIENKGADRLLVVVTDGEILWSSETGDFAWPESTALPENLRGVYREEPRYLDLREAGSEGEPSVRDPRFLDAVAELSSAIRGIPKEDMIGEDVRQHRITRRWTMSAVTALLFLVTAAVLTANEVRVQRDAAVVRSIASRAQVLLDQRGELIETAALLAVESVRRSPGLEDRSWLWGLLPMLPDPVAQWLREFLAIRELPSLEADQALRATLALLPKRAAEMDCSVDGDVRIAEVSPDGTSLATAPAEGFVRVWDTLTGRQRAQFAVDGVRTLRFRPGHEHLLVISEGTAQIFDYSTDATKELAATVGHRATDAVYDSTGKFLVTAGFDGTTRVYDANTYLEVARMQNSQTMVFVAASAKAAEIVAWNNELAEIFTSPGPPAQTLDLSGDVGSRFEYSADGGQLARLSAGNYAMLLQDVRTKAPLVFDSRTWDMSFSGDSQSFAQASPEWFARVYDLPSCLRMGTYWEVGASGTMEPRDIRGRVSCHGFNAIRHNDSVETVDLSHDGYYLATTSRDGTFRVWRARSGQEVLRLVKAVEGEPRGMWFSHDGRYVSAWGSNFCRTWDSNGHRQALGLRHLDQILDAALSADGRRVAALSNHPLMRGRGFVWDRETGEKIAEVDAEKSVWLSSDGERLLVDGKQFYDVANSELIGELLPVGDENLLVAGSASQLRVSATEDNALVVRGMDDDEERGRTGPLARSIVSANLSDDGCCVIGMLENNGIVLWSWQLGAPAKLVELSTKPLHLAIDQGGTRFAMVGASDRQSVSVRSFDEALSELELRHESDVYNLHFHPDGEYLVTGSKDGWARVWDLASARVVAQLKHDRDAEVRVARFSPDGRYVLSGGGRSDRMARLWLWRTRDLVELACSRLSRNLTAAEWRQYVGSGQARPTCDSIRQ